MADAKISENTKLTLGFVITLLGVPAVLYQKFGAIDTQFGISNTKIDQLVDGQKTTNSILERMSMKQDGTIEQVVEVKSHQQETDRRLDALERTVGEIKAGK